MEDNGQRVGMSRFWTHGPLVLALTACIVPIFAWGAMAASAAGRGAEIEPQTVLVALATTMGISAIVTLACLALGMSAALLWFLEGPAMRRLITFVMVSTVVTGLIVRNYGWIGLLSMFPGGAGQALYTPLLVVAVMTFALSPLVFFVIRLGIDQVRHEAIDAARILGASELSTLWRVVIGQLGHPVLLAATLTFASSMAYFITPRMLGGDNYYFIGNLILKTLDQSGDFLGATYISLYLAAPIVLLGSIIWGLSVAGRDQSGEFAHER